MWLRAQIVDKEEVHERREMEVCLSKTWSPPPRSWVKCNVGVKWDSANKRCGGSWLLRDTRGKVSMHRRRAFSDIKSHDEAKFQVLLWAIESMGDHHQNRVIFAIDDALMSKHCSATESLAQLQMALCEVD